MSARYAAAQRVVANSQFEVVEDYVLDLFTASAMVAVYEALGEDARAKFDQVPLPRLASFCLSKVS